MLSRDYKECPRCRGRGAVAEGTNLGVVAYDCPRCEGDGEVPIDGA